LWEEAIVFDDIKGELRKKAFKQIRDTLLFAECNDAQPLTSSLGNYGCEKAKEMYSEMIPAMIEAGVFPCVQDSDTGELEILNFYANKMLDRRPRRSVSKWKPCWRGLGQHGRSSTQRS
jgi:hypothetical protein